MRTAIYSSLIGYTDIWAAQKLPFQGQQPSAIFSFLLPVSMPVIFAILYCKIHTVTNEFICQDKLHVLSAKARLIKSEAFQNFICPKFPWWYGAKET